MKYLIIRFYALLPSAALFVLAGCASFPQNQIPTVTDMPSVSQFQHKPSVYLDVRMFNGRPDVAGSEPNPVKNATLLKHMRNIVAQTAGKSGLFSSYNFDESSKASADYTIQLYFYDYGNYFAAFASGLITGFTLGIIPGGGTDHYTLKATVVGRNGIPMETFSSTDSIRMWVGIWFIPVMGNTPAKAAQQTFGNMILNAFKQMVGKGELKYSLRGALRTRAAA